MVQFRENVCVEGGHVDTGVTELLLNEPKVVGFSKEHCGVGVPGTMNGIVLRDVCCFEGLFKTKIETGGGELFPAGAGKERGIDVNWLIEYLLFVVDVFSNVVDDFAIEVDVPLLAFFPFSFPVADNQIHVADALQEQIADLQIGYF